MRHCSFVAPRAPRHVKCQAGQCSRGGRQDEGCADTVDAAHRVPIGRVLITPAEAKRAIFVDYESSQDQPPTLLGTLVESDLRQYIVHPSFDTCAERWGARQVRTNDHATLVQALVRRSLEEDRVIVSWSEFDCNHLRRAAPTVRRDLEQRFRNAIYTARRWRRRLHPKIEGDNSLVSYLALNRFPVPERFIGEVVGDALRLIRAQLLEERNYETLSPAARRGWKTVVRHNQYDLKGMEHVILVASAELAQ